MSKENPGVIFDASNSWNGFNHQGKLAILIAIKQILKICDTTASIDESRKKLSDYFIEIEYLEDFSLGKVKEGIDEYYSVHQVKNHATNAASDYASALLGLAYHVEKMPTIEKAYLHATNKIDFGGGGVHEYVKELIQSPAELNSILNRINESRSDTLKKQALYERKKGRRESFIVRLKQALSEAYSTTKELDASNIDDALEKLEQKTRAQILAISSLPDELIEKIVVYSYDIEGHTQNYCEVDRIGTLIRQEISRSIDVLELPALWNTEKYIQNRYLYLMGKLDEHIIDRNLNYPLYIDNSLDRKIRLIQIYEWLTNDEFDTADKDFYQYQLKSIFSEYADEYCKRCTLRKCDTCLLVPAINKIGRFTKSEMENFLALTCPSNTEGLSISTIGKYLSARQIRNPFLKGISEISIPFEEDKRAITYINRETLQYILTTLEIDEDYQDKGEICTDIVKNKELFELLMDYDCFISKNISCVSIQDEAIKLGKSPVENAELEARGKEHIAHLKDVSIVTLADFISSI